MKKLLLTTVLLIIGCMIMVGCYRTAARILYSEAPVAYKAVAEGTLKAEVKCLQGDDKLYSCALVSDNAIVEASDVADATWIVNGNAIANASELLIIEALEAADEVALELTYNGEKVQFTK